MRNIIPVLFAVFAAGSSFAQGLLNNGAYIVFSGAGQVYIDGAGNGDYLSQANGRITPSGTSIITLEGDWTNNAGNTGFTADAGTVVMNDAAQSINGTATTTFYNLTLQGSGTKTLNVQTNVGGVSTTTGIFSLGTRPLDLNSNRLVITNPSTAAVTYTTGYVISETNAANNPSLMVWRTGTNTGTYTYPFGTVAGAQIPFSFAKTSAISLELQVSTRPTATSANTPWATSVTHMYDPNLGQDGSDEAVIDRWWSIRGDGNISDNATFSYRGTENTLMVPYNTGNLGAQYWDAAWLPNNSVLGSAAAVLAGTGSVTAPISIVSGLTTPWVLSSAAAPLPVTFLEFSAACSGNEVLVNWKTASETNNDYFVIERSSDGAHFSAIGNTDSQAPGGNSTSTLSYTYTDAAPLNTTTYYRIRQVDFNGDDGHSGLVPVEPCSGAASTVDVFGTGSDIEVMINAVFAGDYNVAVYDMRGRIISERTLNVAEGINRTRLNLNYPESAMYMVRVFSAAGELTAKRVYVSKFD